MLFYCLRAKFLILFQYKPHARGDEPHEQKDFLAEQEINPTYVGMNRLEMIFGSRWKRKLHVRGAGPTAIFEGWCDFLVNPTCVGMDRSSWVRILRVLGKPHARGDEP